MVFLENTIVFDAILCYMKSLCFILTISATRMEKVHIWASSIKPPMDSGWNFGHAGYGRECSWYDGTPTIGMPTSFTCKENAIGRYAYVWFETTQYSHICEVEIFGSPKATPGTETLRSQEPPKTCDNIHSQHP